MDASASAQHVAIGQHHFKTDHVIARHAVFQTAWAAGIRRDVSTNSAIFHARRIGRIKQFLRAHRGLQISGKYARLNHRNRIGKANFLDPIHLNEGQRNPAARGHASAYVPESAAPRCDWNFFKRSEAEQLTHVVCRSGEDNNFRLVRREPFIAAVRSERVRIGCNCIIA